MPFLGSNDSFSACHMGKETSDPSSGCQAGSLEGFPKASYLFKRPPRAVSFLRWLGGPTRLSPIIGFVDADYATHDRTTDQRRSYHRERIRGPDAAIEDRWKPEIEVINNRKIGLTTIESKAGCRAA